MPKKDGESISYDTPELRKAIAQILQEMSGGNSINQVDPMTGLPQLNNEGPAGGYAPAARPSFGPPPGTVAAPPGGAGLIFGGGSPFPVDRRGQDLQNALVLATHMIPALQKFGQSDAGQGGADLLRRILGRG